VSSVKLRSVRRHSSAQVRPTGPVHADAFVMTGR
jgi:hypothetical protein